MVKKKNEIKKKKSFIGKEMSLNPQKLKKQLFTRRTILDLFQKSET